MGFAGVNPRGNFAASDSAIGGGGGGTIAQITSADGSIAIVHPTGPIADLSSQLATVTDFTATLLAPATAMDVGGMNGGAVGVSGGEGAYDIEVNFLNAAGVGPQTIQFRWNGITTSLRARKADWLNGSTNSNDWVISNSAAYSFSSTGECRFIGRLEARSGRTRVLHLTGYTKDGNNDVLFLWGEITDTSTNFNSFGLVASLAGGLGTGTMIKLTPVYSNA